MSKRVKLIILAALVVAAVLTTGTLLFLSRDNTSATPALNGNTATITPPAPPPATAAPPVVTPPTQAAPPVVVQPKKTVSTTNTTQQAAQKAFAPFTGAWRVQDGTLVINADRTGTQTINLGCGIAALNDCNEVDELLFSGPVNGHLTATVKKVTVPRGQQPVYSAGGASNAADTFQLTFKLGRNGHVLEVTRGVKGPLSVNPFWCDKVAFDSGFSECGA